ncbi:helix-turn-helix domain-containing protein [Pandoraea commovens]|uniref:AraC family transcriptional regulator n=1 Tax=Pandoraea commovens TaxID=2508289 RepID=A0A5E4XU78_9BURK|nr:helix-turn-helix domain-containing protein [Pandoraea commovens]VVE39957.1 AraC family transcriptional regulator [Pandoraea commovens]
MIPKRDIPHIFESRDSDEISSYIRSIYSDNRFSLTSRIDNSVSIVGQQWPGFGIYSFHSESPFSFAINQSRENYLFSSCFHGEAYRRVGNEEALCKRGDIIPTPPLGEAFCESGTSGFGHQSIVIDAKSLHEFTSIWLGLEPEECLNLDLIVFHERLSGEWKKASACLQQMTTITPSPDFAIHSLIEHMFKILLSNHPNNFSKIIGSDRYANEKYARIAIQIIKENPLKFSTLTSISREIGCPSYDLESGIRRVTGKSFLELHYLSRLDGVRYELRMSRNKAFVSILRKFGFSLSLKFISEYLAHHGELPSDTFRKNRNHPAPIEETRRPPSSWRFVIMEYIDTSLSGAITLQQIADQTGLTPHRTIDLFKELFSQTPMQFVMQRRLERATALLRETTESVLAIAHQCGFGSQSYLTSSMKKHYGTTPGQLRKSLTKGRD